MFSHWQRQREGRTAYLPKVNDSEKSATLPIERQTRYRTTRRDCSLIPASKPCSTLCNALQCSATYHFLPLRKSNVRLYNDNDKMHRNDLTSSDRIGSRCIGACKIHRCDAKMVECIVEVKRNGTESRDCDRIPKRSNLKRIR